jgi:hypothetical protein
VVASTGLEKILVRAQYSINLQLNITSVDYWQVLLFKVQHRHFHFYCRACTLEKSDAKSCAQQIMLPFRKIVQKFLEMAE